MLFHKNCNKQIQYNTTTFRARAGKICEACIIVHWEGSCRRP